MNLNTNLNLSSNLKTNQTNFWKNKGWGKKTKDDEKSLSNKPFKMSFDDFEDEPQVYFDTTTIDNIDPIQESAKFKLFHSSQNLFITGKAGTGKSTLLKEFVNYCKSKKLNVAVVAPTGIAAINVGGVTIHSFFQLSIDNPQELKKLNPIKKKLLEAIDVLIVDEISMVSNLHFDQMDKRLNQAKFGQNPHNRQFGGVRVILFGDLFQLGPVIKDDEDLGYFFESRTFGQMVRMGNMEMHELNRIWRQDDVEFINLLGQIRQGQATDQDLELINHKLTSENPSQLSQDKKISILCTLNNQVNRYNTQILNTINQPTHTFSGKLSGEFGHFDSLPPEALELKQTCLVVFVKNDLEKKWVNGDFGQVLRFGYKLTLEKNKTERYEFYWDYQQQSAQIHKDLAKFKDQGYVIKQAGYVIEVQIQRTSQIVQVLKDTWEKKQYVPIEMVNEEEGETTFETKIKEKTVGSYNQFPLKLGYAITVHKSQGMTLSGAIIDFSGGSFGSGLLYVALSRVKSMDNLYLTKPLGINDILLDPKVIQAYQELKSIGNGGIIS
jgi:ATP-dependent DNA helicase PIF1